MDSILDVAWKDEFVLDLLKKLGAAEKIKKEEPYLWKYFDSSLHLSSRIALDCIEEGKLFRLAKSYTGESAPNYSVSEIVRFVAASASP